VSEAGCLGVAILAGVGTGAFRSVEDGVKSMVSLAERFEPDPARMRAYQERFEKYRTLWPLMKDFLRT
jgi:xylulokinase